MVSPRRQAARTPRIGALFVEKGLITEGQLALALEEQQQSGRLLGEICVARYGIDRLRLADVLAEQWEGMGAAPAAASFSLEDTLRMLLDEAQATRAELRSETRGLDRRLVMLEELVVAVAQTLAELKPSTAARATRGRTTSGSSTAKKPAATRATAKDSKPRPRRTTSS